MNNFLELKKIFKIKIDGNDENEGVGIQFERNGYYVRENLDIWNRITPLKDSFKI